MRPVNGLVSLPSKFSVAETLDHLESLLRKKKVMIFARVDHGGEAQKAGLEMPPAQLLIFGNPRIGTPIMLAAPTATIDLPMKALAWQDATGTVWLSYNDLEYLKSRFGLADELLRDLRGLAALVEQAAG